ncbi:MAG: hypothetical protein WBC13_08175 [Dokdonella sp.]|uniref:hypothetical protein n=2 Tax=Dokdonella sp. TaxID=2291710 RepID=UPI001B4A66E1|nr:hypothetical protein [Dokdonella sp.]MBP6328250.1 hypothetical protein [Dokdonella sp.]HNV07766.1 hypothetical protein [Dokdonella sp.]HQV49229.1 hypothetical protein [Dokdonella sp.]
MTPSITPCRMWAIVPVADMIRGRAGFLTRQWNGAAKVIWLPGAATPPFWSSPDGRLKLRNLEETLILFIVPANAGSASQQPRAVHPP